MRVAPQVEHSHAACAQHELGEPVRFSQASTPQRFEDLQQHLLHEIVCSRWRSQVTKAIEPNPRPHAAAHFGLGLAIALSDARREVGIAESPVHGSPFYAEGTGARKEFRGQTSITRACR